MNQQHIGHRLQALLKKEFAQIRRDRRLAMSLIVPPVLQLLLFGFALDANVSNLRLGVVDYSQTPQSREFLAQMTESKSFRFAGGYLDQAELTDQISRGRIDAGVIVPYEFGRNLSRGMPVDVQVILNAVNANTAAIGQGYAEGVIQTYNMNQQSTVRARLRSVNLKGGIVEMVTTFLYNPGLVTAWFIATGTFGVLLILNGSLVASTAMIKERERGTVEQLLMTPADTAEIIIAKIAPLFVLLMMMVLFATLIMKVAFNVPFRGSLLVVLAGAALCVLSGIGIGTFIATYTRSAQQAQLMSFFVNPPLATLSGALTPVEAMPSWLQPVTYLNPIRHFGIITRGTLIRGSGIDAIWPNFLALALFTVLMVGLSVWRFRKQLG